MNNLSIALFAAAFAYGVTPAFGDDGPAKPVGENDATSSKASQSNAPRALPSKADKQKAIDATMRASDAPPPGAWAATGDFPPYYGKSVKEWQEEKKRRYERLEKLTPQEQDERSAERRRQTERWKKEALGGSDSK